MHIDTISALGFSVRVGTTSVREPRRPLLVFNGIGASIELTEPFTEAMQRVGIPSVVFDIPGVGGSEKTLKPYRFSGLAKLAGSVLEKQDIHGSVDVLGVSWGGALAQQFAKDYPDRCNKLVLAATSAGAIKVPGRLGAILKMVSPRRYIDPEFMTRSAGHLYGGDLRDKPSLAELLLRSTAPPSRVGYVMQLLAGTGWTRLSAAVRVDLETDLQTRFCGRRADQFDDDLVADERLSKPVRGDTGEQTICRPANHCRRRNPL